MIRNLDRQVLSKSEISRIMGIDRKTVSRNINKSSVPKYKRENKKDRELSRKLCLRVKPQIKNLLKFIYMVFNMRYRIKLPLIIHFFNK